MLFEELLATGFTRAQARLAEIWILRGGPAQYGKLRLPDFTPKKKQLDELGYDPSSGTMRAVHEAEQRAYKHGYEAGQLEAEQRIRARIEYLELVRITQDTVNYARRKQVLVARERQYERDLARLIDREDQLMKRERHLERLERKHSFTFGDNP